MGGVNQSDPVKSINQGFITLKTVPVFFLNDMILITICFTTFNYENSLYLFLSMVNFHKECHRKKRKYPVLISLLA